METQTRFHPRFTLFLSLSVSSYPGPWTWISVSFSQCLGPDPSPLSSSRAVSFLHHVSYTLLSPWHSLAWESTCFFHTRFQHFPFWPFSPPNLALTLLIVKTQPPFFATVKRGRHVSFSSRSVHFSPCSCITSCPPRVVSPRFSAVCTVAVHLVLFSFARSSWQTVVGGIRYYIRTGVALASDTERLRNVLTVVK